MKVIGLDLQPLEGAVIVGDVGVQVGADPPSVADAVDGPVPQVALPAASVPEAAAASDQGVDSSTTRG